MSFRSKALAAAATVTLVGGVGAVGLFGAASAGAATPSCGPFCVDIFSREFGSHLSPHFVLDVFRQGARTGQPIILFRTSNTDRAEDFNADFQGRVSDFFGAGLVSPAVDLHFGGCIGLPTGPCHFPDDPAFEIEYTPLGASTGLCVGLAAQAFQGEKVTLQPCGNSAKTVWIVDTGNSVTVARGYVPLVNGSDTNFSHPFVLTYPQNGYPTDIPRPVLTVTNLTGFTGNFLIPVLGTVNDNQLWGADFGVLR